MYAEKIVTPLPELDENGLLADPSSWDENIAQTIAEINGIELLLTDHWRIIYALREYYLKYNAPPVMSRLCRKQGIGSDCIHQLFCTCLTAWRIAGLPDPGEEAKTYLSTR